ncbi:Serine hydroxymethyltransferase [Acidilobus saccharovorans 345-15]|uniref:Serine hydroxymethyltransferase n=1 Tax=Acidilobus saccharovorans (strain DSM 16705 / JCM 18335 / VKM B-2471 / 345-15) TaxID=666510 RepID=D9Q2V2_ACIS3|nr:serine hydroxymethyltransferase [Acidilobus saccharovorans]ADL19640.1 Serine hydroxymethyltransferase [Acidilobus saccharovorans 345-15]
MIDRDTFVKIFELTNSQNVWRLKETINLIASENVMSPAAMAVYINDFMHRYAEGKPFKRHYQGTKYIDELEVLADKLMGELLDTDMVDLRPISGTIANAAVFRALAAPGEQAVIAPVQAGAHVSHTKFGTLGALGIKQVELPYDEERMNVDVDKAVKVIEQVKPKFAVLGGSVYLFPHPVKEIAEAVHSVGGKLVYDAAHVLGLIVGKAWENPLKHGADVITASTHKTFPGPQGGVIFFSDEATYKEVGKTIFPWFVSSHHLHRIPATAVVALEMKEYGHNYAEQITKNAKKLAEALAERGFTVLGESMGYTMSHQVLVDVSKQGGGAKVAAELEQANIILNKNLLPHDPPEAVRNPSGLRIGVQEMTRFGMKEPEMEVIADFMERVAIKGEDPAKVREEVKQFRSQFTKVHYAYTLDDLQGITYADAIKLLE